MKKNIIIGILAVLTVLSTFFGMYQRTEAIKQRQLAEQNAIMAQHNAQMAQENEKQARAQMQMAMVSKVEAEKQLQLAKEECAKKK